MNYIEIRVQQLIEERDKNQGTMEIQWYNRLINELHWANQMTTNKKELQNCNLDKRKRSRIKN